MIRLERWEMQFSYAGTPMLVGSVYDDDLKYGNHPFRDGEFIHTSALRLLDVENKIAVTRNTKYKLGAPRAVHE